MNRTQLKKIILETISDALLEFDEIPDSIDFTGEWIDPDQKHIEDQVRLAACLFDTTYEELVQKINSSKSVELTDKVWAKLDNTLSYNVNKVEKAKEIADEYGYHYNDAMFGYVNNREMSRPIIVYKKGQAPFVVSGEPELLFASAFKVKPQVIMVLL